MKSPNRLLSAVDARRHVDKPETGYLIPIVFVTGDLEYLRSIGSPLWKVLKEGAEIGRVPENLDALLGDSKSILSYTLDSRGQQWALLQERIREVGFEGLSLFSGMSDDEIDACLAKSVRIDCQKGDKLIKKGNPAKNLYAVIRGNLEVKSGDEVVAVRSPGDIIGEIAFFLTLPRTMDVVAATDDVEVVSFGESALRKLIKTQPEAATTLLFNMSKLLCVKVVGTAPYGWRHQGQPPGSRKDWMSMSLEFVRPWEVVTHAAQARCSSTQRVKNAYSLARAV